MSREIIEAVRAIEREKGIEENTLIHALEDALLAAYKKTPGATRHATVELDAESGDFRVFSIDIPTDLEARLLEEARERAITELEQAELENGERSHVLISDDDLDLDWSQVPEHLIKRADVTPENFGRIAAQTAKQVILQRIREAEREMMYEEYVDRVGEVVTGIVQQAGDRNNVLVDLGKVEALLPRSEQVDGERYEQGSRIKAVITEVRSGTKGPQVILSRRDPELIKTLFELEVPEIADGLVEIRGVAREPGYRSKIAVESHAAGVDPVGACVGPRGSRVRMVVSELRGEKIDIIPWNTEPARFVAKALSPARVREVYIDDETRDATVIVPDDQLALAIGKEGLNARLAARLTGWKIDIQSDTEFAQAESEAAFGGGDDEAFTGRCVAILSTGKRCPNAALPGSRFCGVPAHQELAAKEARGEDISANIVQPVESEPEGEISEELSVPENELAEGSASADAVEVAEEPVAPEAELAAPDQVPAGIPLEQEEEAKPEVLAAATPEEEEPAAG
jgi:N utilization substance protein A